MSNVMERVDANKVNPFIWIGSVVRALLQIAWLIVYTSVGGSFLIFESLVFGNRKLEDWIVRNWAWTQLRLAGVDVDVRGAENIPPGGCLFLFNHMSYADIYVTFGFLPRPFRFGAKIELFSIPIFGATMKAVGVLPIVRNNRQAVLKVYENAIERVRRGECFALAPEGTRQTAEALAPFKLGPFIFAINAQMPVVPVLIAGANHVQPKGSILMNVGAFQRKVLMQILPALPTEGLKNDDVKVFAEKVRAAMVPAHLELYKEYHRTNPT